MCTRPPNLNGYFLLLLLSLNFENVPSSTLKPILFLLFVIHQLPDSLVLLEAYCVDAYETGSVSRLVVPLHVHTNQLLVV